MSIGKNPLLDPEDKKLFKADDDWWHNAVIWKTGNDWFAYANGYRIAADRLVESIMQDRMEIDFLVYPIVFLYRQSIELYLKCIIKDSKNLLELGGSFPKNHNILKLWIEAQSLLIKIWPEGQEEDLDKIGYFIKQFSEHDPSSESFRYPEDKKGQKAIKDISHINLRHLKEIMNDLIESLDGAHSGLIDYLDNRGEMSQ
jgi:hypothetical protein